MAKDPAFLFYPGDYLRDTQNLSEKTQVAYDRIMCEHMRNICISHQQLNFFTKRLSDEEKSELMLMLTKVDKGFQISWVAESICKRKAYSESRRKNKKGKTKNISESYDLHMENEIVIENENTNEDIIWDKEKEKFFNDFRWKESFCRQKLIDIMELEKRMKDFISDLELKEEYKPLKDLKSHFTNLFNKKNGTHKQTLGTSEARIEKLRNLKV